MNKKELIVTNTLWYRLRNFFRNIFLNKKNEKNIVDKDNSIKVDVSNNNFIRDISYKNEMIEFNRKKELAENLMNGKLCISDLSDIEVDGMIEYFTTYINEMNQKLEQIKTSILNLKKKDSNSSTQI